MSGKAVKIDGGKVKIKYSGENESYRISVEHPSGVGEVFESTYGGCPACGNMWAGTGRPQISMMPDAFYGDPYRLHWCCCGAIWLEIPDENGEILQIVLHQIS